MTKPSFLFKQTRKSADNFNINLNSRALGLLLDMVTSIETKHCRWLKCIFVSLVSISGSGGPWLRRKQFVFYHTSYSYRWHFSGLKPEFCFFVSIHKFCSIFNFHLGHIYCRLRSEKSVFRL